jgi:hypothetical protein
VSDKLIEEIAEVLQRNSPLSAEEALSMARTAAVFAYSPMAVKMVMVTRLVDVVKEANMLLVEITKAVGNDPMPTKDGVIAGKKEN